MNSIANQSFAELGGRLSILSRQKADHVELDRLLHRLGDTPPQQRDVVLLDIYRLVFPHAFAEEAVLWPVARRVLPDGPELTLRIEQEHQRINELVTRLETLEPGTPDHQAKLDAIVELLREDVRDEEDALLPQLQKKLSVAQLRVLGLCWEAVRRISPTRPHPIVARRPPGNVLSALPLSLLDRSRDRIDMLLHRGEGAAAPLLHSLSAGLAAASHAVEYLPGMRSGEDRSTRIARRPGMRWGTLAVVALAAGTAGAAARRWR